MGGKKRGQKCLPKAAERDIETGRLADHAIEQKDLTQLRKLAAVRGLVNSSLRARCWPLLCGPNSHLPSQTPPKSTHTTPTENFSSSSNVAPASSRTSKTGQGVPTSSQPFPSKPSTAHNHAGQQQQQQQQQKHCQQGHETGSKHGAGGGEWRGAWAERVARRSGTGSNSCAVDVEWQRFEELANTKHRDSQVVAVDVDRSLWAFMKGASEAELLAKRVQLQRLINAAVSAHATTTTATTNTDTANSSCPSPAAAPQSTSVSPPPNTSPSSQTVASSSTIATPSSCSTPGPPSVIASPPANVPSNTQLASARAGTAQAIEMQHSSSSATTNTCTPGVNASSDPASAYDPNPVLTRSPAVSRSVNDTTTNNNNISSSSSGGGSKGNGSNTHTAGPGDERACQLVELRGNGHASKGSPVIAEPSKSGPVVAEPSKGSPVVAELSDTASPATCGPCIHFKCKTQSPPPAAGVAAEQATAERAAAATHSSMQQHTAAAAVGNLSTSREASPKPVVVCPLSGAVRLPASPPAAAAHPPAGTAGTAGAAGADMSATESCSSEPPFSANCSFSIASTHGITPASSFPTNPSLSSVSTHGITPVSSFQSNHSFSTTPTRGFTPASSSFSTALASASQVGTSFSALPSIPAETPTVTGATSASAHSTALPSTSPTLPPPPTDTPTATGAAPPASALGSGTADAGSSVADAGCADTGGNGATAPPITSFTLPPAPTETPAAPAVGAVADLGCVPSSPLPSTLSKGAAHALSPTSRDQHHEAYTIRHNSKGSESNATTPKAQDTTTMAAAPPGSEMTALATSFVSARSEPHSDREHPCALCEPLQQPEHTKTGMAASNSVQPEAMDSRGAHHSSNSHKDGLSFVSARSEPHSDGEHPCALHKPQQPEHTETEMATSNSVHEAMDRYEGHAINGPTQSLHSEHGMHPGMQQQQQQQQQEVHPEELQIPPPQPHQSQQQNDRQPRDQQQQPSADHQEVFYYQGLHDVASVLLLVMGSERAAFPLLCRLIGPMGPLRDATRPDLLPVLEVLGILYPIMDVADPQIAQQLREAGLPPFFALSWFITWFSHNVTELQDAARLFDLFLSSHPLMPLYLGAVAMCAVREELLECEDMPMMHSVLNNLRIPQLTLPHTLKVGSRVYSTILGSHGGMHRHPADGRATSFPGSKSAESSIASARLAHQEGDGSKKPNCSSALDVLIQAALQLLKDAPPLALIKHTRTPLLVSVAPAAQLHPQLNCWTTPLHPPQATQAAKQPPLSRLLCVLGLGGHARGQGRGVLLLFRVVRQLLAVLVRQGGMRVAVGSLRAVGGQGLRWGGRGVSGLGWVGSSLGAASTSSLRGVPAPTGGGAQYYSRSAGVQMALTGEPKPNSNNTSAAARVHEDSADIDHPLSDRVAPGGYMAHSVDQDSRFGGREPEHSGNVPPMGHGVEHEIVGPSIAGSTVCNRSHSHSHVYRREGGGWSGSRGHSVEMVGVGRQPGGPRAAVAGPENGADEKWGRSCEGEKEVGHPQMDDGQALQLRFRGQAKGSGIGCGSAGSNDAGQSPKSSSSSGRRLAFDGVQHATDTSGGGGLNKTMLSLAVTTLSASALAGAYFVTTYGKGHRE